MEMHSTNELHGESSPVFVSFPVESFDLSQCEITRPNTPECQPSVTDTPAEISAARSPASALTNAWEVVEGGKYPVSQECLESIMQKALWLPHVGLHRLKGEVPWSDHEQRILKSAADIVINLAKNVDVAVRLHKNSYHMMPDYDAYVHMQPTEELAQVKVCPASIAMCDIATGVVIDHSAEAVRTSKGLWRVLTHESMHLAGKKIIIPGLIAPNTATWTWRSRLTDKGYDAQRLAGLTEATVEMGVYRAARHTQIVSHAPSCPTHAPHVIAAEDLILDAAKFHGKKPAVIEKALYRYHFGGEQEGLHMLQDGVGVERLNTFLALPMHPSREEMIHAMDDGLYSKQAKEKLIRWAGIHPLHNLFEWQED